MHLTDKLVTRTFAVKYVVMSISAAICWRHDRAWPVNEEENLNTTEV